ncbi:hypothetical protein PCO31110_01612 [Pandoraea communis]|uniref:Transmembrane protein n=1 Tax=Pandoraea communis TaxID=2508297 RepID=A0A5E4TW93_9BURK|nr:hypothetical protein [Pandoraea communis]VVD90864.1 hypothetical protein PCO31110_01612 [Pandoraea communis]
MNAQIKAWISFAVPTGLEAAFFVAWKGFDIQAAGNVLMFWIWFMSILVTLASIVVDPLPPKAYSSVRAVLAAISILALAGSLAWFGHFVTAAIYVFGQLCAWSYVERGRKKGNESAEVKGAR